MNKKIKFLILGYSMYVTHTIYNVCMFSFHNQQVNPLKVFITNRRNISEKIDIISLWKSVIFQITDPTQNDGNKTCKQLACIQTFILKIRFDRSNIRSDSLKIWFCSCKKKKKSIFIKGLSFLDNTTHRSFH